MSPYQETDMERVVRIENFLAKNFTTVQMNEDLMWLCARAKENSNLRAALQKVKPILGAAASDPVVQGKTREMRQAIYKQVEEALKRVNG